MAKNLENKMVCKNCNQVEIGKDPEDKKWYEVNNDTQLHFYKCPNAPHKTRKYSAYPPRGATKDIEVTAIVSEIKVIKERLENLETAVKALVATSGGQEVLG